MSGNIKNWTDTEDATITREYPHATWNRLFSILPNRTRTAIVQRASYLTVKREVKREAHNKIFIDKDELIRLRKDENLTYKEIAKRFSVCREVIHRAVREYGLEEKKYLISRTSKLDYKTLYELYWIHNLSLREMEKVLNMSNRSILARMDELGISRRSISDAQSIKHIDKQICIPCSVCGKDIHTTKEAVEYGKKYCSTACKNDAMKKKITKICQNCDEKFTTTPSVVNAGRGIFCSSKCQYESAKKGEMCFCLHCGKEFYKPVCKINQKYCSAECRNNDKQFQRKRLRKVLRGLNKKPTAPERRIIDIIQKYELPFKYVGNGELIIHTLNPDFVECNGKKQIIEVFGDIFHDEKKKRDAFNSKLSWKATEFGRKAIFSQLGYDTLILWEKDINKWDDTEIADIIKQFNNKNE